MIRTLRFKFHFDGAIAVPELGTAAAGFAEVRRRTDERGLPGSQGVPSLLDGEAEIGLFARSRDRMRYIGTIGDVLRAEMQRSANLAVRISGTREYAVTLRIWKAFGPALFASSGDNIRNGVAGFGVVCAGCTMLVTFGHPSP